MPPKVKTSREKIIDAGIELIRESGLDSLCARSLAKKLGTSTQPIFSNFDSMEELIEAITKKAREISLAHTQKIIDSGIYPPYKASGMAYIRFAEEERELFRLLFMNKSSRLDNFEGYEKIIDGMKCALNISRDVALSIHFQLWAFVHGIATMVNTDYLKLEEESVSEMLTNIYEGLKFRYNINSTQIGK